jgi:hypothetical protein
LKHTSAHASSSNANHHPAVDRDVIHLDTPLGEQLLDVAVGQPETQVPADPWGA